MAKPKIIVFTTSYHPFVGGVEIAVREIAGRLKDRFDFLIVTARQKNDLLRYENRSEGKVLRVGWGTCLDKWFLPIWACAKLSLAQNVYQTKLGTIVFGVDISQGALAAAFFKLLHPKTKFIFNVQYGYGGDRIRRGRFGLIDLAFKFILKRADLVTVISTYLLGVVREYGYKGPVEVMPNGVDLEKFKVKSEKLKSKDKDSKIIITTSRLVQKNGVDVLIKAVAEVKKEVPGVQCHIIGDGPEKISYQLLVKSLKLENNVKFFGEISHDQIPNYLHKADIFVRPSRSEGMGNSFVEAMAASLPVIGTRTGGITDVIEDGTGLYAKVDDPQDLAEKIISLFRDPNFAASLARGGRKMAKERFSWDKISGQYEQVFRQYCGGEISIIRILIVTPLFPPQIGGPALYAQNLGAEFEKMGHKPSTLSFGPYLIYPTGLRHLIYFFSLFWRALRSDIILSLDYFSVGLPAAVVSFFLRKPLVVRVEGDFLWESFVERTEKNVTLPQFYKYKQPLSLKELLVEKNSSLVLKKASYLVFSSEWRRKMIMGAFNVPLEKTAIIRNVFPARLKAPYLKIKTHSKIILWAGRMLYLKNLHRLVRVFAKVNNGVWKLCLVGDGPEKESLKSKVKSLKLENKVRFIDPLPREELLKLYYKVAFFVLLSLSDVGPNVIVDAVAGGLPFIITKETGYSELFLKSALLVDPLNDEEIENGLKTMMNDEERKIYAKKLNSMNLTHDWEMAAREWLELFAKTINR